MAPLLYNTIVNYTVEYFSLMTTVAASIDMKFLNYLSNKCPNFQITVFIIENCSRM